MVVLSIEAYSKLVDDVENKLDAAANDLLDEVEKAILNRLPIAEAFSG